MLISSLISSVRARSHTVAPAVISFLCCLCLLSACGGDGDFLAWNRGALTFRGAYEENGVTFVCRFTLSAEDNGDRVLTASCLSPESAEGLVYTERDGTFTATLGDVTVTLPERPAALSALRLCLPKNPVLCEVTFDGGKKAETVTADDGIYTFMYADGALPETILCDDGIYHRSLRILPEE